MLFRVYYWLCDLVFINDWRMDKLRLRLDYFIEVEVFLLVVFLFDVV